MRKILLLLLAIFLCGCTKTITVANTSASAQYIVNTSNEQIFEDFLPATYIGNGAGMGFTDTMQITSEDLLQFAISTEEGQEFYGDDFKYTISKTDTLKILDNYLAEYEFNPNEITSAESVRTLFIKVSATPENRVSRYYFRSVKLIDENTIEVLFDDQYGDAIMITADVLDDLTVRYTSVDARNVASTGMSKGYIPMWSDPVFNEFNTYNDLTLEDLIEIYGTNYTVNFYYDTGKTYMVYFGVYTFEDGSWFLGEFSGKYYNGIHHKVRAGSSEIIEISFDDIAEIPTDEVYVTSGQSTKEGISFINGTEIGNTLNDVLSSFPAISNLEDDEIYNDEFLEKVLGFDGVNIDNISKSKISHEYLYYINSQEESENSYQKIAGIYSIDGAESIIYYTEKVLEKTVFLHFNKAGLLYKCSILENEEIFDIIIQQELDKLVEFEITDEMIVDFAEYYSEYNKNNSRRFAGEMLLLPDFDNINDIDYEDFIFFVNGACYYEDWFNYGMSQENFEDTASKLFVNLPKDFEHTSTDSYEFEDGTYNALDFDIWTETFYRLTDLEYKAGIYTASFDSFYFTETDLTDLARGSYNMWTLIRYITNSNITTNDPYETLINDVFINENYEKLNYNTEKITITFTLSDNDDYPITYLSKKTEVPEEEYEVDYEDQLALMTESELYIEEHTSDEILEAFYPATFIFKDFTSASSLSSADLLQFAIMTDVLQPTQTKNTSISTDGLTRKIDLEFMENTLEMYFANTSFLASETEHANYDNIDDILSVDTRAYADFYSYYSLFSVDVLNDDEIEVVLENKYGLDTRIVAKITENEIKYTSKETITLPETASSDTSIAVSYINGSSYTEIFNDFSSVAYGIFNDFSDGSELSSDELFTYAVLSGGTEVYDGDYISLAKIVSFFDANLESYVFDPMEVSIAVYDSQNGKFEDSDIDIEEGTASYKLKSARAISEDEIQITLSDLYGSDRLLTAKVYGVGSIKISVSDTL